MHFTIRRLLFMITTVNPLTSWRCVHFGLHLTVNQFIFMIPTINQLHFWHCVPLDLRLTDNLYSLFCYFVYICTLSCFVLQLLHNNFPSDE